MRHRVFISHCEKNADVAADVCRRIERQGVRCWIAPRDILVGEDFALRVMEAIETSAVFVIIVSHHSNVSHFVKAEAEQAFGCKIPIFPLRIEDVEIEKGLKLFLSIAHRVDAFSPRRSEGIDRFVDAVVAKALKGKGGLPRSAGIDWAAVARAVGPGARHYIAQWKRMDDLHTRIGWTWEACLGGPLWPFYRGMTAFGILMIAIVAALIVLGARVAGPAEGALAGLVSGWLLTALLVGAAGSAAYRRHVDTVLVGRRQPGSAARSLWMTGAGGLLIVMLALAGQGGTTPEPVAPLTIANYLVDATPARGETSARPGLPDPIREDARRREELQEAYNSGQADIASTILAANAADTAAGTTDAMDNMTTDTMIAVDNRL